MVRRRDVLADVGVHSYQGGQLDGSDLDMALHVLQDGRGQWE